MTPRQRAALELLVEEHLEGISVKGEEITLTFPDRRMAATFDRLVRDIRGMSNGDESHD